MKRYEPDQRQPEEDVGVYVDRELRRIADSLISLRSGFILEKTNVAPSKPQDGEVRYADGVNWNPGSGTGFYGYKNGTGWVFLG